MHPAILAALLASLMSPPEGSGDVAPALPLPDVDESQLVEDATTDAPSAQPVAAESVAAERAAEPDPATRMTWWQPRSFGCLPGPRPCYRTTAARLALFAGSVIVTSTSLALYFTLSDRSRIGDPALQLAGAGIVALTGVIVGGAVALLSGDGPTLPDRITPATLAVSFWPGGTRVRGEAIPVGLTASFAPTLTFPNQLGRLRLLGSFGGDLGNHVAADPRPPLAADSDAFPVAMVSRGWSFQLGLDLALRRPYPLLRQQGWRGQLEFRYKPLVWFARDQLLLGDQPRVSERIAMMPLNFGLRWHISPRQRFTTYLGPRWDFVGYGTRGAVGHARPDIGPFYSESWFDIDIPMSKPATAERARVVGQLTVGYVHSRFEGHGFDNGAVVGFLGYMVGQFSIRVRPLGSTIAYQFELGSRFGQGVHPYFRFGIVLPSIGVGR